MTNSEPPKRSSLKIILSLLAAFTFLLILFLGSLPTILSSSWGNKTIVQMINSGIDGKISFNKLSISWFGNQEIEGAKIYDQAGKEILALDKANISQGLASLALHLGKIGTYELSGLQAIIEQDDQGIINLKKAISQKKVEAASKVLYTIFVSDVNALASLEKNKNHHFQIRGKTSHDNLQGSFNLDLKIDEINADKIFSDVHQIDTNQIGKIQVQANATNFPIRLLDELLATSDERFKGLLLAALGEKLNLNLEKVKGKEGINLRLKVQTPFLNGLVDGVLKNDRLIVHENDSIEWILHPKCVEILNNFNLSPYKVELKKPTKSHFNLEKMNLVFDFKRKNQSIIDLVNSYLSARFIVDQADLNISQPIGQISIQKLQLLIDASEKSDKIDLLMDAQASRGSSLTAINVKGILNKSFKPEELTSLKNNEFSIDIKGLPIKLLDDIMEKSHLLADTLGESIDAQLNVSYKETPAFVLNLNSSVIKIDPLHFKMDHNLSLSQPATISYQLPSSLLNVLLLKNNRLKVSDSVTIKIELNKISIPIIAFKSDTLSKVMSDSIFDATMRSGPINIIGFPEGGILQIVDAFASITGKTFANSQISFNAKANPSDGNHSMQHLVGNNLVMKVNTGLNMLKNEQLQFNDFVAEINSSIAQAKFHGQFNSGKLFLMSPATIRYQLSPTAISQLGLNSLKLDDTARLNMTIDADPNGISLSDISTLSLKGSLHVDKINLYGNAASIQQLSMPWNIHAPSNLISINIQGQTQLNSNRSSGSLEGNLEISDWIRNNQLNFSGVSILSYLKLNNFPVAFLEKMTSQDDLIGLIGPSIDMNFKTETMLAGKMAGITHMSLKGSGLDGQGTFKIADGTLTNLENEPAAINFVLTPEKFQVLKKRFQSQKQSPIVLESPARIKIKIPSLSFTFSENPNSWLKSSVTSTFSIDNLDLKDLANQRAVWLGEIEGTINSPQVQKDIMFSINGMHSHASGSSLTFSASGKTENPFKADGRLNTDNLALQLDSNLQQFPVKILAQFLNFGEQFPQRISAVLGDNIDADIHVKIDHLKGPIVMSLKGSNGSIDLDAKISNGLLTLNNNFYTKVNLTPEFGSLVLDDVFPLASGLIGSDNPMIINIDPKGFSLPIKNFDISQIRIEAASLELGKVKFKSEGKLGTILGLFNPSGNDVISVWFTPLYVSMKQGSVHFSRMDMLILDTYPIATWGEVDLANDRVNMTIGLTGQAMKKGFNVQGLGADYVLQIPFKGTIDNASIDKKKATAKIAALIASNRGPEGLLIGTALHIASGGLTEQKAPAPTTNPLPWSTGDTPSDTPESTDNKSTKKNPLHQVEDKASSLLRNLIPF